MKAYIITLSKIKSSYDSALDVFENLKKLNCQPVLFEGTYGNKADVLFQKFNINLDTSNSFNLKENWKTTSPGVKGCFRSHYRLWRRCIQLNEDIAIFEDDVIFYRSFVPVKFKDILILSINYDWSVMSDPYKKYLENDRKRNIALKYKGQFMPGASGYVIKPHAAKILVERYKNSYLPTDCAINKEILDIKIHSQLIGRSKTMNEKTSLTRSKAWI